MTHSLIPCYQTPRAWRCVAATMALACTQIVLLQASDIPANGASTLPRSPDAILRELTDFSAKGMSQQLGPNYEFYHPGGGDPDFPEIYQPPLKSPPPDAGPDVKRLHYQLGGPWTKEAGDFSSTQGQVIYVPDHKFEMDRKTKLPNDGIGVDRITIIEMSNQVFTEKPEEPWWGGSRPEPTAKSWVQAAGEKIGTPIAIARGQGGWANSGLILFSSGFMGTAGTVTARGTDPTFTFPATKRPTSIAITSKNQFALVTVVDTASMKGQVAVFSLTGGGKKLPSRTTGKTIIPA